MNCGDTFLRIFEAIPGSLRKIHSMFYADLLCCVGLSPCSGGEAWVS